MISMANVGYMTIEGEEQGLISAGCSSEASIGNKCQADHIDQILVLSLAHHMGNRENSGHATLDPLVITKYLDKSSPLLAQALNRREPFKCLIDFYRSNGIDEELFYTISLKGCILADLTLDMPHAVLQNDGELQEHLAIRYEEIRWTHHKGSTSGYALWDFDNEIR